MREQRQYEREKATVNERERERETAKERSEREGNFFLLGSNNFYARTDKQTLIPRHTRAHATYRGRERKKESRVILT